MAITANTGSNNWNTNGAWVGSVQPTAADDVIIPASATVTITAAGAVCRSLTVDSGATLSHNNNIGLTLGDGTAGAGNVALSINSGSTISFTGPSGVYNFISTSGTQQTIDTGGKTISNITVNGAGSSYVLSSALTLSTTFTLTAGTFDTGNYAVSSARFDSANSNTRTLTLGSTTWTLTGTSSVIWNTNTTTNMTFNAGTSTILSDVATANNAVFDFGNLSMYNVTKTGTASKTNYFLIQGTLTCTGTFTVNGNSAINRILVAAANRGTLTTTPGTSATITAATVTTSNTDWQDIVGAGAGSWNLSAITGNSGDCGGNSGITFTTPATQTNTGATGNWSDATKWTSRVPLPQDDVVINTGSGTITADMPRLGKSIDFTGFTGTASFNITTALFGSLTLVSGMTLTSHTQEISFSGRSTHTITSAGKQFGNQIAFYAPSGTYTLQDAITTSSTINVYNGTFDTNSYTTTSTTFGSAVTTTRAVNITNSTINLVATIGTVWNFGTTTGLTFTSTGSTIVLVGQTYLLRTFAGGGLTYNNLTNTTANSPCVVNVTGNNSFNNITLGSGRALTASAAAIQTVRGTVTGSGANNGYMYVWPSSNNYISAPDSAALSITGAMDIRARVAPDDWTPGVEQWVVSKWQVSGSQRSYTFTIGTDGKLRFYTSTAGSALTNTEVSSVATGFTDGDAKWIRVTYDPATTTTKFYTAADNASMPSSWTQLGTDVAIGGATSIYDSTAQLEIGSYASGATSPFIGKIYQVQIRDNVLDDGTGIQFDANFATKTFGANSFTEGSSNAATVTITGQAAQAGDGRVLFASATAGTVTNWSKPSGGIITSSNDYFVVQDIRMYQPQSFFAGANSVLISNTFGVYATAPTTYEHVQSIAAITASGPSVTATYPSATTPGSLLVAYFTSSGSQGASFTPPAGWSLAVTQTQNALMYIYYKIADGTETTVTFTQSTSRALNTTIVEYTGFSGTPTLDVTDSNTAGAATTLSTTATTGPTNTAQPALAVAMLANASTMGATTGLTNSFMEDSTLTNSSSAYKGAVKELTNLAAVETTFSWTTARSNYPIGLAVFINVSPSTFKPQVIFM